MKTVKVSALRHIKADGQSNITLLEIFNQAYMNGLEAGGIHHANALKRVERRLKRIERKLG